jgi:predicted nucleic acid-binding protein
MIVSDASPIISFARAGMLSLMKEVVGELTVPTLNAAQCSRHSA